MSRTANTHLGPPRRGGPNSRAAATWLFARFGWRVTGELPNAPRSVLVIAPHTSNWDFALCMTSMFAFGLRIDWIAKNSMFFFPCGPMLKWLGGHPVDRSKNTGRVQAAIDHLNDSPQFCLGIAPEGTRALVDHWKSGFWRIADGAKVPIIPVALDWSRKEVRIMSQFDTTADQEADIAAVHGRFDKSMARKPELFAEYSPPE